MLSKEDGTDRFHWVAQRLLHAQEEERRHISREMHDDIGNRVVLLAFSIRRLMNRHPAREYTEEYSRAGCRFMSRRMENARSTTRLPMSSCISREMCRRSSSWAWRSRCATQ